MRTLVEVANEYACFLWQSERFMEVRRWQAARKRETTNARCADTIWRRVRPRGAEPDAVQQAIQLWAEYVLPSAGPPFWKAFVSRLETVRAVRGAATSSSPER